MARVIAHTNVKAWCPFQRIDSPLLHEFLVMEGGSVCVSNGSIEGEPIHGLGPVTRRPHRHLSCLLCRLCGSGTRGHPGGHCLSLGLGPKSLVPWDPLADDRHRRRRIASRHSLSTDSLGEAAQDQIRPGNLSGRLPWLLGPSVAFLPC